jgi:reverse transcriptase-like protein
MVDINPESLVKNGLFPENIPPVYTADNLWKALPQNISFEPKTISGEACSYNASKRGGQRRIFQVPHPLFLKGEGEIFQSRWKEIEAVFTKSHGSASRPILKNDDVRHVHFTAHSELPGLRLKRLSRFKYCLITDVSRFYYSIYTHVIPWAIHGKREAKKGQHDRKLFGNGLDQIIRKAQNNQSIGIPVGPDVSKIVAELIMSAVDARFIETSNKGISYVRHVDDYWIGAHTQEECEKHLQKLRGALRYFQLDINETKTRIVSTKYVFGESWPLEFETEIVNGLRRNKDDLLPIFGRIIERATLDNDEGMIKRVIKIIDEHQLWQRHWEILEHFLAQCAVQFAHSFDYVARVIAWRARTNKEIERKLWIEIARTTTLQSASLGRDSEVCWAIWLQKELSSPVPKRLSDNIVSNNSSLVLSFLAHFPKYGMASDKRLYESIVDRVEGDPYSGSDWPLALELNYLGHGQKIPWKAATCHQDLQSLHKARASIIRWDAPPKVFEEQGNDPTPPRAIEKVGSDYEDDETYEDDDTNGGDDADLNEAFNAAKASDNT